ncbi:UNVERIFIED_CONTAM: hypothetical protein Scaly_0680000 [Sesamum calycinum]|uniref:S-protein homolog n=1 Tax=Sesamum calycinum TaxID=2727403 RepID=A0AAW2R6M9_9LAMI
MEYWRPALIVLSLVFTTSEALYPKSRVTVADAIPGDAITAHCYSKDDDLGTHQLAYLQSFSWTFRYSLIGSTEFFCTISTQYGSGNYMVYGNYIMLNRCGLNCLWQVQAGGPCLQQTRGGLWCQPWQKQT